MKIQRVEFTLELSEIRSKRIYIQEVRDIFPALESRCTIQADGTKYTVPIMAHSDSVYHLHLTKWFNKRSAHELIGKFAIEVVTPMKEYDLTII